MFTCLKKFLANAFSCVFCKDFYSKPYFGQEKSLETAPLECKKPEKTVKTKRNGQKKLD